MSNGTITMSLEEVESLAREALTKNGTSEANARSVAHSIRASEAAGIRSHGLARLATYCEHARSGKVDGLAVPTLHRLGLGAVRVDARTGFAHPAIDMGLVPLAESARRLSGTNRLQIEGFNGQFCCLHARWRARCLCASIRELHSISSLKLKSASA